MGKFIAQFFSALFRFLLGIHLPLILCLYCGLAAAQQADPPSAVEVAPEDNIGEAERTETGTNENPEARRRAEREASGQDGEPKKTFELDLYASARVHAIQAFDVETAQNEYSLGDGASRVGVSAAWNFHRNWSLFGRLESGFDILDTFTSKAQNDDGGAFSARLHNLAIESDNFYAKYGKSWSVYYKVAGAADRFSIFGGNAAAVYNAGTDGGATGTGRADNALQTELYLDFSRWADFIKPFNLNVQYQNGEPIPGVSGRTYGNQWSFSAWFETDNDVGIGLAWHGAEINELEDPVFKLAGIDGDAQAWSLALKSYGDRWLASLVVAKHENMEVTDQLKYFDGVGVELFAQWEFHDRWWLIAGGNWLDPDDDETQAGEYEISYTVLGLRYTFDSFNRMLYAEWRNDSGTLSDGTPRKNELTFGVRWDFGY